MSKKKGKNKKRVEEQDVSGPLLPSWRIFPSLGSLTGLTPPSLVPDAPKKPPAIDSAKLDLLKTSEPYKVMRRMPDLVQCITAWRAWRVTTEKNQLRLQALGVERIWQPKEIVEAKCEKGSTGFLTMSVFGAITKTTPNHLAPCWSCTCGVWAFKELAGLVEAVTAYAEVPVLGQVQLWGKVIETENGYRAEKAYPSELWILNPEHEELGLIYNVPVRMIRD